MATTKSRMSKKEYDKICKDQRRYNGWTNWETWNLNLWVSNDEGLYHLQQDWRPFTESTAQQFAHDVLPNGTPDMDSAHDYHKVNWAEIVEAWNE